MRISDWSSDVFSSDLLRGRDLAQLDARGLQLVNVMLNAGLQPVREEDEVAPLNSYLRWLPCVFDPAADKRQWYTQLMRSEEHTSELQSLMRNSYAVFCLKKKNITTTKNTTTYL